MVHTLAERGADLNILDDQGSAPLHLAACTHHVETVRALVKLGANPSARDSRGNTPVAYTRGRISLLRRLSPHRMQSDLLREIGEVLG